MGNEHDNQQQQLDALMKAVLASSKYRNVSEELIAAIGAQALLKQRKLKDAVKATKNTLHQVGGAYLDEHIDYAVWLDTLQNAKQAGVQEQLQQACRNLMSYHASTRERLPILDQFYREIFAALPPVSSILDLACGLNPLALPWMPLPENATYFAYDIYHDMTNFLQAWFALDGTQGSARVSDVLHDCPSQQADVAFLLKAIPCLEQLDKKACHELLPNIHANYLVVSFPVRSLGGRKKGMIEHYETAFREMIKDQQWEIRRLEFESELVFVVNKEHSTISPSL
jgi:16S rRNA (guanine(1405)-N(7))-methyltransferase